MEELKSLTKGLKVYKEILSYGKPILATTLCKLLNLNKSTISRILFSLHKEGLIKYLEETNEIIAKEINTNSNKKTRIELLCNKTKILLQDINKLTKESSYLGVFDNDKILYINQINNTDFKIKRSIGMHASLHTNALGKSLLAFGNYNLKNLKLNSYTFNTIIKIKDLKQNLENIRTQGYSIDDREDNINMRCVAAPLFNHENILIASIGISGNKDNLTLEKSHHFGKAISKLANNYSLLC